MQMKLKSGKEINLGYRVDRYDPRDYIYSVVPRALPTSIDNGSQIARIMNQNPEGSCPGHAICAAAEFHYWRRLTNKVDLSQRWAYRKARENDEWPGENYHGSSLRAAVKAWAHLGICEEKYWPYEAYPVPEESPEFDLVRWEGEPKAGAQENALRYPVQSYRRCRTFFDVKHAIHEHGLVLVGATVHSGWDIWGQDTIVYDNTVHPLGGHAFVLVGYDEVRKVYHIANSWGEEWGTGGKALYIYEDAHQNIHDAWVVTVPLLDNP